MHKLLVACSLAGCLQVDSGRPVPLEDFSRAWSTVYCERTFACYSPAEIAEMWDPDFPDERSCTVYLTEALDDLLADIYREIYRGTAEYDADAATSCLSTVHAASCWEIRQGLDLVTAQCEPIIY